MTKDEFLIKYDLSNNIIYHYKRTFPECVNGKELDYAKLDKTIQDRFKLRDELKDLLAECSAKDIYIAFEDKGKNYRELANQWLSNIYAYYDKPRLIPKKALDNLLKVKECIDNGSIKLKR